LPVLLEYALKKCKNDYKVGSFFHLIEWRCQKIYVDNHDVIKHSSQDYRVVIDDNVFLPTITQSVQWNSEKLVARLKNILCISNDETYFECSEDEHDEDRPLRNEEIMQMATQHNLPMFISIDGSLDNNSAMVSISIIIPDIQDTDINMEWQHRLAKVLLIRSWKLPI
jgi:hypothetical protein